MIFGQPILRNNDKILCSLFVLEPSPGHYIHYYTDYVFNTGHRKVILRNCKAIQSRRCCALIKYVTFCNLYEYRRRHRYFPSFAKMATNEPVNKILYIPRSAYKVKVDIMTSLGRLLVWVHFIMFVDRYDRAQHVYTCKRK